VELPSAPGFDFEVREYHPPLLGYPFVWAMMEADQLLGAQCGHGVGASLIVTELDFGDGGSEQFYDCSNLAANKSLLGHVIQHSDFR
jgi:hypothetical protein